MPSQPKIVPERDGPAEVGRAARTRMMRRVVAAKRATDAMSRYHIDKVSTVEAKQERPNLRAVLAARRAARTFSKKSDVDPPFSDMQEQKSKAQSVIGISAARTRWNQSSRQVFATHRWGAAVDKVSDASAAPTKASISVAERKVDQEQQRENLEPQSSINQPATTIGIAAEDFEPQLSALNQHQKQEQGRVEEKEAKDLQPAVDQTHHESLPIPFEDSDDETGGADGSGATVGFSSAGNSAATQEQEQEALVAGWTQLQDGLEDEFDIWLDEGMRQRKNGRIRVGRRQKDSNGRSSSSSRSSSREIQHRGNIGAGNNNNNNSDGDSDSDSSGDGGMTFSLLDAAAADADDAVVEFAVRSDEANAQAAREQCTLLSTQLRRALAKLQRLRQQQQRLRAAAVEKAAETQDLEEELDEERERFADAEAEWERQRAADALMRANGRLGIDLNVGGGSAKMQAEADAKRKRIEDRRRMLLEAGAEGDDEDAFAGDDDGAASAKAALQRLRAWWNKLVRRNMPLKSDLRTVQARYGASVASYFRFTHWILVNYLILGACAAVSYGYHLESMYSAALVDRPTLSRAGFLLDRGIEFTGQVPRSWQYSSFATTERTHYVAVSVALQIVLMWRTLYKWVTEDRLLKENEVLEAVSSQAKYARLALNAWDMAAKRPTEARDQRFAIGSTLSVTLHEETLAAKRGERTRAQRAVWVLRKVAGFLLYLTLQCACWAAIMYLTAQSSALAATLKAQYPSVASTGASASVVPAAVSVINAGLPPFIKLIVKLEKWDSAGDEAKQMTSRLYFAKIFNAMIQVFSFGLLINPVLFTSHETPSSLFGDITFTSIRMAAQKEFEGGSGSGFQCHGEMAAAGFFNLVLTEFIVGKVLAGGVPLLQRTVARFKQARNPAAKPFAKAEFQVAQQMVNLFYFQLLAFMAFPLAPYSVLAVAVFWFINFKWEKLILLHFKSKPRQPWSAKNAGSFFIFFYGITLALGIFGNFWFLSTQTLPKSCGVQDTFAGVCAATTAAATTTTTATSDSGSTDSATAATVSVSTYNATTETCVLDPNSTSYAFFSDESNCAADVGYPRCVCGGSLACGPFTGDTDGFAPLVAYVGATQGLSVVYSLLTSNVAFVWALLLAACLKASMLGNSLRVKEDVNIEKESMWKSMIENSERKVRKLTKKVGLLEQVANKKQKA